MQNLCPQNFRKRGEKDGNQEILEETMGDFFPNLANDKNVQLQTAELTPSRINPKESIPGHIILKFLKTKGKEEFLKSSERNNTLHTGGKNSNNCISHKELWRPKRNDRVFFKY